MSLRCFARRDASILHIILQQSSILLLTGNWKTILGTSLCCLDWVASRCRSKSLSYPRNSDLKSYPSTPPFKEDTGLAWAMLFAHHSPWIQSFPGTPDKVKPSIFGEQNTPSPRARDTSCSRLRTCPTCQGRSGCHLPESLLSTHGYSQRWMIWPRTGYGLQGM